MARVPVVDAPTQSLQPAAIPTQRLDAPTAAFGASVAGEGMQEEGQAATKSSDDMAQYALQYQALNNKIASDTAFNNFLPAVEKARVDFIANNQGVDPTTGKPKAEQNLGDFYKQANAIRDQFGQNLDNPVAQEMYDSTSRRYFAGVQASTASFAAEERQKAIRSTSAAVIQNNQAVALQAPEDSQQFKDAMTHIDLQHQFLANVNGWSPDEAKAHRADDVGAVYFGKVRNALAAPNGYIAAKQIFDSHTGDMTPKQIEEASSMLKTSAHANAIQTSARLTVDGGAAPNFEAVSAAVHGQEGPWGATGPDTPYGNAHGGMQVLDSTGKAMAEKISIPWQPELMTQTTPEAVAYQKQIGDAYLKEGMEAYPGDMKSALKYYFGGPDQSQWGPKTEAYANQVLARLGPQQEAAIPPIPMDKNMTADGYLASATQAAMDRSAALYPNDPVAQHENFAAAMEIIRPRAAVIAETKKDNFSKIEDWMIGNQVSDPSVIQKQFPQEWNALPGPMKSRLQSLALGQGNQPTVQRQNQFNYLMGLSGSDSATFADPSKTVLTNYDLTINDRKRLESLQASMQKNDQAKAQRETQVKTYLSNPIVANIINQTWPDSGARIKDQGYNTFLGELEGIVIAGHPDGKPPSQQEIETAAQSLVLTKKGGFMQPDQHGYDVPAAAQQKITSAFTAKYNRPPSAEEIGKWYSLNGGANRDWSK